MKRIVFLFAIIFAITSCKKDHVPDPPATQPTQTTYSIDDFTKFTPGNYWVYQVFQVDTNGNDMSLDAQLDSSYVSNDSVINGNTYHVFHENLDHFPFIECVRDSGEYVVTSYGQRLFTTTNFNIVFDSTGSIPGNLEVNTSVSSQMQSLNVAAGTFQCFDAKTTRHYLYQVPSYVQHRIWNMDYASGVGLVLGTIYYSSPSCHWEDRLLRYHVQ